MLRQFCRLYLEPVPDDTTLIRWANLMGPQTVERLNDRVVELANSLKVTRGRKLVVIVGNRSSVEQAVRTGRGGERCTRLGHCLAAAAAVPQTD